MAKALKRMMVEEYVSDLGQTRNLIIVDPGPMSVENAEAFRRDLREQAGGAVFQLVHNRTVRRALEETVYRGHEDALSPLLKGQSAVLYGGEGAIPIAKVVRDWRRRFKPLTVKGGVADGEVLDAATVEGLADLPGLPQLRGMLLGAVLGSARGLAASLQAVYGGIARVLQARIEEAEGAGADGDGDNQGA